MSDHLFMVDGGGAGDALRAAAARMAAELGLRPALIREGVVVLIDPATPLHEHPDGDGIVIGELYESNTISATPVDGQAGAFAARYWGDYIAIRLCGAACRCEIILSPFGQRQLFHYRVDQLHLFASSADMIARSGWFDAQIEWSNVARFLARPELRDETTCLQGLSAVPPGTQTRITDAGIDQRLIWHPRRFTGVPVEDGPRSRLANVIDESIATISCRAVRPVVELSGGLDSSIIAAALAGKRTDVAAITIVPESVDGNELSFAEPLARFLEIPLTIIRVDAADVALDMADARVTARPGIHLVARHFDRLIAEATIRLGGDLLLNGGGGDNIFCRIT